MIYNDDYEISEEFLEKLKREYADIEHPLFMDEIPNDITANEDLEALYKLLAEGETRDSIAQKYKEVGNGYISDGRRFYEAAISSYTNGIQAESKDDLLNSQLYSNRAFVYLKLGEFVKCIDDCKRSIKCNKHNYKAYYRGSLASYKISLYRQSFLFCLECVKAITGSDDAKGVDVLSDVDEEFGKLYTRVTQKLQQFEVEKNSIKSNELKEEEKRRCDDYKLVEFLKSNGVEVLPNIYEVPKSQKVSFYESDGVVHTSCLFVYDEMNITDYIEDYSYDTSVGDHLDVMFVDSNYPILFNRHNALCYYQVDDDVLYGFSVNDELNKVMNDVKKVYRVMIIHIVQDIKVLDCYLIK